jgi:hypothetical protein
MSMRMNSLVYCTPDVGWGRHKKILRKSHPLWDVIDTTTAGCYLLDYVGDASPSESLVPHVPPKLAGTSELPRIPGKSLVAQRDRVGVVWH